MPLALASRLHLQTLVELLLVGECFVTEDESNHQVSFSAVAKKNAFKK